MLILNLCCSNDADYILFCVVDIDADAARQEEENQMLEDANKWLNNKSVKEKRHQKTGATALHVAAAKGYMKVIR